MGVDIKTPSKYILAHLFWPEIKVLSKFEQAFFAQAFNQQIGEGNKYDNHCNTILFVKKFFKGFPITI